MPEISEEGLKAVEIACGHALGGFELRLKAMEVMLNFTQEQFTRFGVQNQNRIDKELGIQQERITAINKRLTEIEVELGMANPLKRLDSKPWMKRIEYTETPIADPLSTDHFDDPPTTEEK